MKSTNPVWMEAIKGQKNGNSVVTWVKKEWIQKTLFLLCGIDLGEHTRNWLWWAPVERGTVEFRGGDAESPHSIFLNLGLYDLLLSWPNGCWVGQNVCSEFSVAVYGKPRTNILANPIRLLLYLPKGHVSRDMFLKLWFNCVRPSCLASSWEVCPLGPSRVWTPPTHLFRTDLPLPASSCVIDLSTCGHACDFTPIGLSSRCLQVSGLCSPFL